ncbi:MAG: hypothetical protein INR73_16495 [Williamsia sp.]|nr:hypothetical protein [Williamsia sp.]
MTLSRKLLVFTMVCMAGVKASAQEMSTPYSVYGIGDLEHRNYNHNSGMGYTGLALKSTLLSSGNNPASLAGLPRSFFTMDISGAARFVTYSGDPITTDNSGNRDFTVKKLGLSTKLNSFWGSGVGFRQLSSVNYSFTKSGNVEGSNDTYAINYSGDGGLHDFYWANAFQLGKHLSLGVTSSYVTGSINQLASLTNAASDTAVSGKRQDSYSHFRFETGAIYSIDLSKNWNFSLGASFADKTKLSVERTLVLKGNSQQVLNESNTTASQFYLPRSYGAGIALSSKAGQTFALDYLFQDWSSLNVKGDGWQLMSSHRISAGAEFARYTTDQFGRNFRKRSFQMGAYVNNSYLQVRNHPINEWGLTGGFSSSTKSGMLYTISAEGGTRGTVQSGLIKENFVQLTWSFSFREFLFSQGRKYN